MCRDSYCRRTHPQREKRMRSESGSVALSKFASCLIAILVLSFSFPAGVSAQAPPVPAAFQPMYTELNNYLVNFNATLPPGSNPPYPTLMAACLKATDSNVGPSLLNSLSGTQLSPISGVQFQIDALKAMGVQALLVEVGFPMLYQPFMDSQNTAYQQQFLNYYAAVANAVRAAGMKLIVENDTLLTNDVQAGWDVAPYYSTLSWNDYQAGRAQTAVTIAQLMQPDYLVVLQEPKTEADNSGQTTANTVSGSVSLLSQILASVQQAGVPNMKVGAGTGTAQVNPDAMEFIQQYVTLPLDFIDFHIYPVNDNYLPIALQIVSTAAAAGKPVAMTECWLWKVLDTELNVLTDDQIRARNPFDFWAPLDAYFLQTMQNLANSAQLLFLDPFDAENFFAQLPYDDSTMNLSSSAILAQQNAAASAAMQNATPDTITGMSYYNSIVVPADTTPPTTPTGLSGVSANPTSAAVSWNAASDNIGVQGYYVLRDGVAVGTTGMWSFQDTGLTEASTHTYTVEAFDLAGNVSPPSTPVVIQTSDVTPPTTPANVTAAAGSCTKATLSWSASQDNTGVTEYLLWMGLSPSSMTQVAIAGGSTTSYGNSTLSPATTYYFAVQAEDKNHNISYMSTIVPVTTPALPVAPPNVLATANSTTKITVTWSPSTGGLSIAHYMVYKGTSTSSMSLVATVNNTSFTDTSVLPSTTYYYSVQAADSGKPPSQSGLSAPVSATTFGPPSVPANLAANPTSCTKVALSWSPSTASAGLKIANYRVYKGSTPSNMTQLVITTNTAYTDTKDTAQTTYYYAVQSADTGKPSDLSAVSPPVQVTTYAYPSVPANLTATPVSASKIALSWSASISGGLNVANYHVYGGTSPTGMSQLAITTNTTYNNMSLSPGKTYYYAVQAADTANDDSALSPTVPATTLQLPTTPTNVVALGMSSTLIAVTWTPSSGPLNIAHYYVFRGTTANNMSQVATTINPLYNDRSVTPGATYYYGIQAADTGQDLSAISPAVAGTALQ